jgi:four helix bundle protein
MDMQNSTGKPFDFGERAFLFGHRVRELVKRLPPLASNFEDGKQAIRASGSVGANYIEADEALSKKDCVKHLRIARKEAKESKHWLKLFDVQGNAELEGERQRLVQEAEELSRILSAMIKKCT